MIWLGALLIGSSAVLVAAGLRSRHSEANSMLKEFLSSELAEPTQPPSVLAAAYERVTTRVASSGRKLRSGRRTRKIEAALPETLSLLAASLDAGSSVLQALSLTAEQGSGPLAEELERVVAETRIGRPFTEAFCEMAERVGSRDLEWTAEAVRIQSTSGGKLADTLRVLADFMRARVEVRGEVRALSAEARLSAKVLTGMPFLIMAYLVAVRPAYVAPLVTTGVGRALLFGALTGIALGTLWMRKIVKVEV